MPSGSGEIEQPCAKGARLVFRAHRTDAVFEARAGCDERVERDVLLYSHPAHADRAVGGPAGLEFRAWTVVRFLNAGIVVDVDEHSIPGGGGAGAAVVRAHHVHTGIVGVA